LASKEGAKATGARRTKKTEQVAPENPIALKTGVLKHQEIIDAVHPDTATNHANTWIRIHIVSIRKIFPEKPLRSTLVE
jgi:hypothetical protein